MFGFFSRFLHVKLPFRVDFCGCFLFASLSVVQYKTNVMKTKDTAVMFTDKKEKKLLHDTRHRRGRKKVWKTAERKLAHKFVFAKQILYAENKAAKNVKFCSFVWWWREREWEHFSISSEEMSLLRHIFVFFFSGQQIKFSQIGCFQVE